LYYFLIQINLILWVQAWYPELIWKRNFTKKNRILPPYRCDYMIKAPSLRMFNCRLGMWLKFLDPQKHALIDNILPTCGNLSRFSFTWKMCVLKRKMCIHHIKGKMAYNTKKHVKDKNLHRFFFLFNPSRFVSKSISQPQVTVYLTF
jgi:hypothetical protein